MYPHIIRLRGPWEYEVLTQLEAAWDLGVGLAGGVTNSGRSKVPGDWGAELGALFRGSVCYKRRFNRPSGLQAHERVWLVIDGVDARGKATLNGTLLGALAGYALPARFDVTDRLESANRLEIIIELPPGNGSDAGILRPGREMLPGGPVGEVQLEIRASQFISRLAVWTDAEQTATLHISGSIDGKPAAHALTVVASADEREVASAVVNAGEPFALVGQFESPPRWIAGSPCAAFVSVEIKLLNQECLWQTARMTAARTLVWNPEIGQLLAGNVSVLPARAWDPPRECFIEGGFDIPGVPPAASAIVCPGILSASAYCMLDVLGIPVIQVVPRLWAAEICPRLAHHPSIVAWTTPPGLPDDFTLPPTRESSFGRPWLSQDKDCPPPP